ncbi:MAG: DUF3048 domain-containing protein [Blautia sp.]|jgi:hypothetical protein
MYWKKGIVICAVAAMAFSGCGKKDAPKDDTVVETQEDKKIDKSKVHIETAEDVQNKEKDTTSQDAPQGQVASYLTGEYVPEAVGRRRPVAIMLNNIQAAVPQSGIAKAGVVYEAPVEGDITRLMGIFEDYDDLEKIGSVRSCRDYYIFYALEFDAIYAHYGQAAYAIPYLEQDFVNNLSGLSSYGDNIYYRTTDRKAPHNVYIGYEGIQEGIKICNYSQEYSADYDGHYQFAKAGESVDLADGTTANKVSLDCYTVNKPWFEYDEASKKYNRFQYGGPQIDELTNEQLAYDNIILEYAQYKVYDQNGYLNIDPITAGTGKYITHGKAIDVRWEKDAPYGVTHYFDQNNQEITLNTGKTWVAIILNDRTDKVSIQ